MRAICLGEIQSEFFFSTKRNDGREGKMAIELIRGERKEEGREGGKKERRSGGGWWKESAS